LTGPAGVAEREKAPKPLLLRRKSVESDYSYPLPWGRADCKRPALGRLAERTVMAASISASEKPDGILEMPQISAVF